MINATIQSAVAYALSEAEFDPCDCDSKCCDKNQQCTCYECYDAAIISFVDYFVMDLIDAIYQTEIGWSHARGVQDYTEQHIIANEGYNVRPDHLFTICTRCAILNDEGV